MSSSETLAELYYGSCGLAENVAIPLNQGFNILGLVLFVVVTTTERAHTHLNVQDKDGNALLHISVRIDQNIVSFNGIGGNGQEENPSKMPVKNGEKYNLLIAYESEGYRIYINGEEFHFFKHRSRNAATSFAVKHGKVYSVSYKRKLEWASERPVKEINCEIETPLEIVLEESGPLSWIQIHGTVKSSAGRFDVNLMNSSREILFHFSPRFEEFCVVRNSCIEGWGTEERNGGIPFIKQQRFVLVIVVEKDFYKTYVNDEEFITFNHRAPANVSRLLIENEIRIHKIMYHKIDQNIVSFNSLGIGGNGPEENPSKMPVKNGEKYNLLIAYESEGYRIYINGEEFYFFKHRSRNPATSFSIIDGKVYSVSYKRKQAWATERPVKELNGEIETPLEIVLEESGPLSWIQIHGTVKSSAGRFDVNLMNSSREILFHFSPRFEEFCVVRNSCIEGWGTEERNGGIPFIKQQRFVLVIVVEKDSYKTYVNDEEFITFNHRAPANVARLLIENDIRIHKIMYRK